MIADTHAQLDDLKKRGALFWRIGFWVFNLLEQSIAGLMDCICLEMKDGKP